MAFPQTPLPLRARIAPGGSPSSPSTWQLVDITSSVRVASGVTITSGRSDEGNRVDPGKCTLTLDNRSGDFCTRNVYGQWYGKLAKGTPLRIGTMAGSDTFTRTRASGWGTAESGQGWSHSSTSQWSVNGSAGLYSVTAANSVNIALLSATELLDVDLQYTISVPAVMTGASFVAGMQCRYQDGNNFYLTSCEFNTGGTVTGKIRRVVGGTMTQLATTGSISGLTYTANQKMRIRVWVDGPAIRLKIWADGGTEPAGWNLDITDTSISKAGLVGPYMWAVAGNTNTTPYSVSTDDLEVEAIEFTGAVYEWPPRWDQSRKDATAPITASGILRRLQQGKTPLRSPIARMIARNAPVAYWPLEDDSGATVAAAGIAGVSAATARAVEFAQSDAPTLAGAKQTAGITASTVMSGAVPAHKATGTWGCVFFAQLLAPPAALTRIMQVNATGTVRTWAVELDSTAYYLRGYDSSGNVVIDDAGAYPATAVPPDWIAWDLVVSQSGGTVTAKLITYGVIGDTGTPVMYVTVDSFSGSAGSPTGWTMQGSLGFNQGRMAHVAVFNYEPPFVTYAFANAANGYAGEVAADRITRLCAEESVQVVVEAGTSEPLGPQRTDTFLNLLYSASDADLGILYEQGAGLAYRPRGALYNRPVEFALDFAVGDVAEPPEPTDDDQNLKNQWTVTRDGGSSAVAIDADSIARSDLLDDSATINVETDGALPYHAAWRLATTTIDELRWPSIKLDLARNTGQIRLWRASAPFPRVTIAHEPSQVTGNAVDLTVLGYTNTLGVFGWDIELNCTPSKPWSDIALFDAARYDSENTTLSAGVNAAATSYVLTFPNLSDAWSTDSTQQPYDQLISGEQVRVPVGGMGAITGSGPYTQTVTGATRSINGISKALPAGAEVHVATPGRYAL